MKSAKQSGLSPLLPSILTWSDLRRTAISGGIPPKPRTIEIIDDTFNLARREVVNVPLLGTVVAGAPILAQENIENYFPIPVEMLPNKEIFMLKVKGDSMIDAGIYNGDRVIVAKADTARNGEIVVALVDDSATVKTFYKERAVSVCSRRTHPWIRLSLMRSRSWAR